MAANTLLGVAMSRKAPPMPPQKAMIASDRNDSRSAPETSERPARPVVICPGNSAIVDVMLASFGSSPAAISAGRVMNDPPPASAFCTPAHRPAANSRSIIEVIARVSTLKRNNAIGVQGLSPCPPAARYSAASTSATGSTRTGMALCRDWPVIGS